MDVGVERLWPNVFPRSSQMRARSYNSLFLRSSIVGSWNRWNIRMSPEASSANSRHQVDP